jgi:UDP-N-acetylglucosamine 2-epimerase
MSVVGARPQFIKAAAMTWGIDGWNANGHAGRFEHIVVHTGQHYDYELSQSFFDELELCEPTINLNVKSGTHAVQTANMMVGLEEAMHRERPDWVVIFGDTNSTLAAALAASKLKIPVAHVEAGLRERNRRIPEEVNKIVADHLSDLCFAPTPIAMDNLAAEGLGGRSLLVGDIMLDTTLRMLERLSDAFTAETLQKYGVAEEAFALATTHRAIIRETPDLLRNVLEALRAMPMPVLLPLHPSTRSAIAAHGLEELIRPGTSLRVVPPIKYSEMLVLLSHCRAVYSDSGGLIKEAYFFKKPCVTLDYQTEWVETLEGAWNVVAGPDKARILRAAARSEPDPAVYKRDVFGTGRTAPRILETLTA